MPNPNHEYGLTPEQISVLEKVDKQRLPDVNYIGPTTGIQTVYSVKKDKFDTYEKYYGKGNTPVWEHEALLDDYVAHEQPLYKQWGNGIAKGQVTAAVTAIEGVTSLGGLITGGINAGIAAFNGEDIADAFSIAYDNKINEALETFKSNMEEWLPNYYTNEQLNADVFSAANLWTANFWADKFIKNVGFTIGALVGGFGVGTAAKGVMYGLSRGLLTANKAAKIVAKGMSGTDKLNRIIRLSKSGQRIDAAVGQLAQISAAAAESSIEAYGAKKEMMDAFIQRYKEQNGEDSMPSEEEMQKFESVANSASNGVLASNMMIVYGLNNIAYKGFLTSMNKARGINNTLVNRGVKFDKDSKSYVLRGGTAKAEAEAVKRSRLRKAVNWTGRTLWTGLRQGGPEALEELAQTITTFTGVDYALSKYDNGGQDNLRDLSESFLGGVKEGFTSKEGQEGMLLGFMTGGLSYHVLGEGRRERKKKAAEDEYLRFVVNTLNKYNAKSEFKKYNAVRTSSAIEDQGDASVQNNKKAYEDAKGKTLASLVQSYSDMNTMDILYDQIDDMSAMSKEDLAKFLDYDVNTEADGLHERLADMRKEVKEFQKLYKNSVQKMNANGIIEHFERMTGKELEPIQKEMIRKTESIYKDAYFGSYAAIYNKTNRYKKLVAEVANGIGVEPFLQRNTQEYKNYLNNVNKRLEELHKDGTLNQEAVNKIREKANDATILADEVVNENASLDKMFTPDGLDEIYKTNREYEKANETTPEADPKDVVKATKYDANKKFDERQANNDNRKKENEDEIKRKQQELNSINQEIQTIQSNQAGSEIYNADNVIGDSNQAGSEILVADNVEGDSDQTGQNELGVLDELLKKKKETEDNLDNLYKKGEQIKNEGENINQERTFNDSIYDEADKLLDQEKEVIKKGDAEARKNLQSKIRDLLGKIGDGKEFETLRKQLDEFHYRIGIAGEIKSSGRNVDNPEVALFNKDFFVLATAKDNTGTSSKEEARKVTEFLSNKSPNEVIPYLKFEVIRDQNHYKPDTFLPHSNKYKFDNDREIAVQVVYVKDGERVVLGVFNKPDAFKDAGGNKLTPEQMASTLPSSKVGQYKDAIFNHSLISAVYNIAEAARQDKNIDTDTIDITEDVLKIVNPEISQGNLDVIEYSKSEEGEMIPNQKTPYTALRDLTPEESPGFFHNGELAIAEVVVTSKGDIIAAPVITPPGVKLPLDSLKNKYADGKVVNRYYALHKDKQGNERWIACEIPDALNVSEENGKLKVSEVLREIVDLVNNTDAKEFKSKEFLSVFNELANRIYMAADHKSKIVIGLYPAVIKGKKVLRVVGNTFDEYLMRRMVELGKNSQFSYIDISVLNEAKNSANDEDILNAFVDEFEKHREKDHPISENVPSYKTDKERFLTKIKYGLDAGNPNEIRNNIFVVTEKNAINYKNIILKAKPNVVINPVNNVTNKTNETVIETKNGAQKEDSSKQFNTEQQENIEQESPETKENENIEEQSPTEINEVDKDAKEDKPKTEKSALDLLKEEEGHHKGKVDNTKKLNAKQIKEPLVDVILENEIEKLRKILPAWLNIKDIKEIATSLRQSGATFGVFVDKMIYLASKAPKGTAYHEAFHAVFNLFLNNHQREQLFAEQEQFRGNKVTEQEIKSWLKDNPGVIVQQEGISNEQQVRNRILEEEMAERFRHWKNYRNTKSINAISRFFNRLWELIKSIFNNSSYLRTLFRDIERGHFKHATIKTDSMLGQVRMSAIPTGYFVTDGIAVNSYLTGNDSRRLINTIAAKYFDLKRGEGIDADIADDILLNKAIAEVAKNYDVEYVFKQNNNNLTSEQKRLLIQFNEALNPDNIEARELLRREIRAIDNILRVSENIKNDAAIEEQGERSFDFRNEMVGGFAALSKEIRTLIAMTTITRKNQFGIEATETVDAHTVYNALSNLLINTEDDQIMKKVRLFRDLASDQVKAFIDVLLSKDLQTQRKFVQSMMFSRTKYTSVLVNVAGKKHKAINANTKDYVAEQLDGWLNNYPATQETKELYIKALENLGNELFINNSLLTFEDCISKANEIINEFDIDVNNETAGIILSPGYLAFSLMAKRGDRTDERVTEFLSMYSDAVPIHECNKLAGAYRALQGFIAQVKNADVNKNAIEDMLSYSKDSDLQTTLVFLMDMAESNVIFDETLGDDNFMNVEGERVWGKIKPSFLMLQANKARRLFKHGVTKESLHEFYSDITDEATRNEVIEYVTQNPIWQQVLDSTLEKDSTDFRRALSKLQIGLTDGIREDALGKTGATWGSMSAGDKMLFMMSCYAEQYTINHSFRTGRDKSNRFYKMYLRVLESSSTAYTVNVPMNVAVTGGEISKRTMEWLYGFVEQEFNRIRRVNNGIGVTLEGYNDSENGRGYRFFLANQLLLPDLRMTLENAAKDETKSLEDFKDEIYESIRITMKDEFDIAVQLLENAGLIKNGMNVLLPTVFQTEKGSINEDVLFTFLLDDYINRTTINQLFDGDLSMSSKNYADVIKRNKGAYAGVQRNIKGQIKVITIEDFKDKTTRGDKVDRDDGQAYQHINWKIWKNVSQGLMTAPVKKAYERILSYDGTNPATDAEFLQTVKMMEAHGSALNSDKDVAFSTLQYKKKSDFTITRELCSVCTNPEAIKTAWENIMGKWQEINTFDSADQMKEYVTDVNKFERATLDYWEAIPGRELMHEKLNLMIEQDAYIIEPTSVSKRSKSNVAKYVKDENGKIISIDKNTVIPNIEEAATYGKQQETPSGEGNIIDGTQKLSLLWSEQPKTEQEQAYVNEYLELLSQRITAKAQLAVNILTNTDPDGKVTFTQKRVMEDIKQSLIDTGASQQLIDMFSVGEDGTPIFDFNNTPNSKEVAIRNYLTHFRQVFKQKVHGDKMTLVSDVGLQIMYYIDNNGKEHIISPYYYNELMQTPEGRKRVKNMNIQTRDLRYDMTSFENGVEQHYAEILIPAREAVKYKIREGQEIDDVTARAFGIRIPTQDKQSMMSYRVVGFLPSYYGSVAVFPKEILVYKSADFDIDKEFMQFFETYKVAKLENDDIVVKEYKFGSYKNIKDEAKRNEAEYEELRQYYKKDRYVSGAVRDLLGTNEEYQNAKREVEKLKRQNKELAKEDFNSMEDVGDLRVNLESLNKMNKELNSTRLKELRIIMWNIKENITNEVFKDLGIPYTLTEYQRQVKNNKPISINVSSINNRLLELSSILLTGNEQAWNATQTAMTDDNAKAIADEIDRLNADEINNLGILHGIHHFNDIVKGLKKVKVGKDNIGIATRSNVTMNLLAHYGVKLNPEYCVRILDKNGKELVFDGFVYNDKLSGKRVNDDMAEGITLQVDAVKGDMPYRLNLTPEVLSAVTTAIGIGMGSRLAYQMAKSKIIVELTQFLEAYTSTITADDLYLTTDEMIAEFEARYIKEHGLSYDEVEDIQLSTDDFLTLTASYKNKVYAEDISNKSVEAQEEIIAKRKEENDNLKKEYHTKQAALLSEFMKLRKISQHVKTVGDIQALQKGDLSTFEEVDLKADALDKLRKNPDGQPFDGLAVVKKSPYLQSLVHALYEQEKVAEHLFLQRNPIVKNLFKNVVALLSSKVSTNAKRKAEIEEEFYNYMISVIFRDNASAEWKQIINDMVLDGHGTLIDMGKVVDELKKEFKNNAFLKRLKKNTVEYREGKYILRSYEGLTTDTRTKLHPDLQDAINVAAETIYTTRKDDKTRDNVRRLIAYPFLTSHMRFTHGSYVKHMNAFMFKPLSDRIRSIREALEEGRLTMVPSFAGYRTAAIYEFMFGLATKPDKKANKYFENVNKLSKSKNFEFIAATESDMKVKQPVTIEFANNEVNAHFEINRNKPHIILKRAKDSYLGFDTNEYGDNLFPMVITLKGQRYMIYQVIKNDYGKAELVDINRESTNTWGRAAVYRQIGTMGYYNQSSYTALPEIFGKKFIEHEVKSASKGKNLDSYTPGHDINALAAIESEMDYNNMLNKNINIDKNLDDMDRLINQIPKDDLGRELPSSINSGFDLDNTEDKKVYQQQATSLNNFYKSIDNDNIQSKAFELLRDYGYTIDFVKSIINSVEKVNEFTSMLKELEVDNLLAFEETEQQVQTKATNIRTVLNSMMTTEQKRKLTKDRNKKC